MLKVFSFTLRFLGRRCYFLSSSCTTQIISSVTSKTVIWSSCSLTALIILCSQPYLILPCQCITEITAKILAGYVEFQESCTSFLNGPVAGILPLFNRQASKDGPKIYFVCYYVFGVFLIWQTCPSTLQFLPFLYYLKTSRIATLKSNAKLLFCCCCYSFMFDFSVFWIFF